MATWEISWEDQLPPVRYQGQRPSCSFEAMLYSGKVINENNIRRGVLVPAPAEVTTFHHDSFVVDFELSTGTLLGDPWNNYDRVPTALGIFRDRGVAAVLSTSYYGYTPVRISDYQAHARLSFRQVLHYVQCRHPVLGSFYVRSDFGYFPAGMIYQLQSPPTVWDDIHMVMFCGCGEVIAGHTLCISTPLDGGGGSWALEGCSGIRCCRSPEPNMCSIQWKWTA